MSGNRLFYGWIIVGFTFIVQFVTIGLCYYAFSVYLKPLSENLGVDRFEISLALSIQVIVVGLLSPVAGRLFAQKPLKPLLFLGAGCLATSFLGLSQITSLWQLYVLFGGLAGIGMVFLGIIPCNLLLANWFDKHRGTAMGVSQFGITISATVLIPGVTWIILSYGWAMSFAVSGIGAILILIPLITFFAVKTPAERGEHPDGIRPVTSASTPEPTADWTFTRAIRERDIWAITFTVGPCYMSIAAIVLSMPSHLTDLGFSAMDAGFAIAMTTLMGAIAKPVMGKLSDHMNKKLVMAIAIGLQATGLFLLLSATDYQAVLIAGFLFGFGYGGVAPLWGVLLATRYGRASFAQIMGANMPMLTPFNITGLPFATFIYGLYGSYVPAYATLLGGYVIAAISLALFRMTPRPQNTVSQA